MNGGVEKTDPNMQERKEKIAKMRRVCGKFDGDLFRKRYRTIDFSCRKKNRNKRRVVNKMNKKGEKQR